MALLTCPALLFPKSACRNDVFQSRRAFKMLSSMICNSAHAKSGIALLITLAFVVLLAALVVAFLSRTTNHRLVANTATNETKADQLARGALDIVVGNLKQEISAGLAYQQRQYLTPAQWHARTGLPTNS